MSYVELILEHYGKYGRLMRLHRPIGIWLLLWPTLWALWLAGAGMPDPKVFAVFVLGTIVMRSAGCIINDFADRGIDPHVRRTADRPLATGEVAPGEALILFFGLMLIALGLVLTLNRLTLWLAVAGAVVAVLYPFTKRWLSAPQFVLGIAFSWGVPMAYAAELGEIPRIGWLLFVSTIVWVVIYDTEYAMADRDDDLAIGVNSTAVLLGDMDRTAIAAMQALFLLALLLVGHNAELGAWYFGSLGVALLLFLYQQFLIRDREPEGCIRAFLNNAWVGGCVFAGILLDYVFRAAAPGGG
ncbi:MAG TPA: 4-hydroxybenzoate octaprenyltransferase [Gammaproteobacteria bacterium]